MMLLACGDLNSMRRFLCLLNSIVDRAVTPHGPEHASELSRERDHGDPFGEKEVQRGRGVEEGQKKFTDRYLCAFRETR